MYVAVRLKGGQGATAPDRLLAPLAPYPIDALSAQFVPRPYRGSAPGHRWGLLSPDPLPLKEPLATPWRQLCIPWSRRSAAGTYAYYMHMVV